MEESSEQKALFEAWAQQAIENGLLVRDGDVFKLTEKGKERRCRAREQYEKSFEYHMTAMLIRAHDLMGEADEGDHH